MRVLILIIPLLFIIGCSNTVNGIDKNYYNKTEEYTKEIYESINKTPVSFPSEYDKIYKFLNSKESKNKSNEKIVKSLSNMYSLNAIAYSEDLTGNGIRKETKNEIEKQVDILENEYGMNIR